MNRAEAQNEIAPGRLSGRNRRTLEGVGVQVTFDTAEQRGLDRIDVNWVACYPKSAVSGFQHARASTRFP